jgi:glycosyltransferase involved in cell wall biosynthesis
MPFAKDNYSTNAMGGTELMKHGLEKRIEKELIDKFQIFVSRAHEELNEDLIPLYWHHDLAGDPEVQHLKDGGWDKYKLHIFNSNWQLQQFNYFLGVPYSKAIVIPNAIEPIAAIEKPSKTDGIIRLIYHTTPHRGLALLVPVFDKLCEKYDNIELDVYSSFSIYGWNQRDEPYQELFDACRNHPKIRYHGAVDNQTVKTAVANADIFAYPSVWMETSCISLMEAMSAGCLSVHSNLGALPETSGGLTRMYQYNEDPNKHALAFYHNLDFAIQEAMAKNVESELYFQKLYADSRYSWGVVELMWRQVLNACS